MKLKDENSFFIQRKDNVSADNENITLIFILDGIKLTESQLTWNPMNPDFGIKGTFSKLTLNGLKNNSDFEFSVNYSGYVFEAYKVNLSAYDKQHFDFFSMEAPL